MMNLASDKARKRILGSMLSQYLGQSVCLLGSLVQSESNGRVLKMKTSDDQFVTVQLQQPFIKLSYKDPDIFQINISSSRCEFIMDHFEAFMQMYKTQGPTFWLRFIISFKTHMEEKVFTSKKWLTLLIQYQIKFIKVLNYVYICIHKKFIESSNTAVKKFINNLITLAINSPSFLEYNCEHWITHFKSSKQLQNILQNILGLSDPCAYDGYTVLIYTVFSDFLGSLSAVFEQWYVKKDLSEEELEKVDYNLIYWLPPFNETEIKASCFEKYLADYWKEELQRMLLTDGIHNTYGAHNKSGCCEKYGKEKKLFSVLQYTSKHTMELVKVMTNDQSMDEYEKVCDGHVHTIPDISVKDISVLTPSVKLCTDHENCCIRIHHNEVCYEPFLCVGSSPCILTCDTNSENLKKKYVSGKFWKNVSIEKFPIDGNKCDASTMAESYDKLIETYLHFQEGTDIDMPMSLLKQHYHQCLNIGINYRRMSRLNRLRKKLTEKHPSNSCQFDLSEPFYVTSLRKNAEHSFIETKEQLCREKGHNAVECQSKCFLQLANSVAIGSSNPFGRVICFSKTLIPVPPAMKYEHSEEIFKELKELESQKCKSKKNIKTSSTENKVNENTKSKSSNSDIQAPVSSSDIVSKDVATNIKTAIPIDSNNEDSEINAADDEIEEILKLIGINENEEVCHKSESGCISYENTSVNDHAVNHSNEAKTVENFLKLIGVNESTPEIASDPVPGTHDSKLKICAYCKKRETQRKMFKKCSKCKEENFPVQHYYCSQECLIEDWVESHEEEHSNYQRG